ncbi:MAG: hypothetical protein U5K75_05500 [Ahrensia sp.]|nr:hypothetical protein [Ahrensia sp.]
MRTISIELSDAQFHALQCLRLDPDFDLTSIAIGQSNAYIQEMANGDEVAFLAMNLPTQKQKLEQSAQANAIGVSPTTSEQVPPISIAVQYHALALKIGIVNATRTDSGEPYPVTNEALNIIKERYSLLNAEVLTKNLLGQHVSENEKKMLRLIQQGNAFFAAVDEAAATIIASGDVADPVATDPRWPKIN